jgi:hypothetical protein
MTILQKSFMENCRMAVSRPLVGDLDGFHDPNEPQHAYLGLDMSREEMETEAL